MNNKLRKDNYLRSLDKVKLVLGNGFDLHCGLPTSYNDFFTNRDGILQPLIKLIEKMEAEGPFFAYLETFSKMLLPLNREKITVWDIAFVWESPIDQKTNKIINWCDIESVIRASLTQKNQLNDYIIGESRDPEKLSWEEVYQILNNKDSRSYYYNVNTFCAAFINRPFLSIGDFYKYLLIQLNKFEQAFGEYIGNIQDRNSSFITNIRQCLRQFSQAETEKEEVYFPNIASIDTFNYTDTNDVEIFNKTNHINGNSLAPIFGIDSNGIDPEVPAFIFTKTYRRMILDMNDDSCFKNKDFENVFVYGHSLNAQDYSYFFPMFDSFPIERKAPKNNVLINKQ
jgi:hypothetical protein